MPWEVTVDNRERLVYETIAMFSNPPYSLEKYWQRDSDAFFFGYSYYRPEPGDCIWVREVVKKEATDASAED